MDKKILRQNYLVKRSKIPIALRKEKSQCIAQRLKSLEIFQEAYSILFFVSFNNEVQTHQLIKDALTDKKVSVPLISNKELLIKEITDFDQLSPGYKNILEPNHNRPDVKIKDLNLVIVPGAAFDKNHYRLGYGGGYYDRLIARSQTADPKPETPIFIGLAFEEQIVNELPVEPHDKKVNFIVTEKRLI